MATNTDLIRRSYDAFARGDMETVLGALDPEIEWTEAAGSPYAGTYSGPDAVVAGVFAPLGTEWDRFEAIPDRFVTDGDTVVTTGEYSGTYSSTGRSFTARFTHIWDLSGEKVVRFEQIADTAKMQEALPERQRS